MPNTISKDKISKIDKTENGPKVRVIEISKSNYALCDASGNIFEPLEILKILKEHEGEAKRLKGPRYWLKGTLEDGIAGHCKINENGNIVNIRGNEWIGMPSNERLYVIPGNNPPCLMVEEASGNPTYILIDFALEPGENVRNALYKPNGTEAPSAQLLRE